MTKITRFSGLWLSENWRATRSEVLRQLLFKFSAEKGTNFWRDFSDYVLDRVFAVMSSNKESEFRRFQAIRVNYLGDLLDIEGCFSWSQRCVYWKAHKVKSLSIRGPDSLFQTWGQESWKRTVDLGRCWRRVSRLHGILDVLENGVWK